ncbi:hypothetical protein [Wohlfahrtiimonas larvae]|nr:hypothetical protein [Wohlfahrtiimonas larvae]
MLSQVETITIDGVNFSFVQVKDILDQLPENSWLAAKSDEFLEHSIFFHEGDVELPFIRLGELPSWSLGYFIIGDVKVGRIIEASDDMAMGLIVDGNLTADHIRAGGNEIYVSGDLQVNGLFFGKYNHGSLRVEGESFANAFISDDYSGWIDNHHWAMTDDECFDDEQISDEEYHEACVEILEAIRPEFLLEQEEVDEPFLWAQLLNYYELEKAMKHNAPILQDSFIEEHQIQFLAEPQEYQAIALPTDFVVNTVANIHNELSTTEVEALAKTMTGLTHSHIFVPEALYNDDHGLSVKFLEGYPERLFLEFIAVRSEYQGELPHNIQMGMNGAALKAQFGDRYAEETFEEYEDSAQGTITLDDLMIELLLENDAVTFVKYQISES